MIKRKLFVAGMTAFAITTATGIAALASQGDVNRNAFGTGAQNQYFAGQNFSNQTDGVFDKGMMNDNGFDRNDFSADDNFEIGTVNNDIDGQNFKAGDNEMSEQSFEAGNNEMSGQGFDTADNEMGGQSFDKADSNSDEKPVLPRKSDEEAMKEGNPKPALPEGVSVEGTTSETDNELPPVPQMTDANQSNKDDKKPPMRAKDNDMSGQGFKAEDNEMGGQGFKAEDNEMGGQSFKAEDNEMGGQGFDSVDNNYDEKPVLPRKSDEEAMKEGNPKPALPMGVTVDDADVLNN